MWDSRILRLKLGFLLSGGSICEQLYFQEIKALVLKERIVLVDRMLSTPKTSNEKMSNFIGKVRPGRLIVLVGRIFNTPKTSNEKMSKFTGKIGQAK